MRTMRPILCALVLAMGLSGPAWAEGFLTDYEDLPLAPGLDEVDGSGLTFDSPAGRIIESYAKGAVREAESALRVAEAAYRFGERGILDVLDAQRVLRTVRADLLEARYQLQSARIELDFLAGRYAQPSSL